MHTGYTGQLASGGPHALYVRRRTRTSLGRAARTAYRGTAGAKLLVPGLTVMHIGYSASSAMPLAAASLGVLTFNVCGNMIITAPLSAMDTVGHCPDEYMPSPGLAVP